ncbi:MAG: S8 family serine peptidase [Nitrospiraceae bacterium]|nr:MAG: S8 family serine peptidase [Nitrospiraceae bacterium]
MKKLFVLFTIFTLFSCGTDRGAGGLSELSVDKKEIASSEKMTTPSADFNPDQNSYKKGEILVKFRPGLPRSRAVRTRQALGGLLMRTFTRMPDLEHIKLPEGTSVPDAIRAYLDDPDVEYAEPNYIRNSSMTIPNDPLFPQQWSLRNTAVIGADIGITGAWDVHTGNGTAVIAVLDTGMDYDHPDLVDNIWINTDEVPGNNIDDDGNGFVDDWRGWDFVRCAQFNPDGICISPKLQDNDPMDDNGHGTHVSGIAGAVGNNNIGIAGINWKIQLMPLKILNADGAGTVADEIEAVQYAVSKNVQIINMSFSGTLFSRAELDAIDFARSAGVLVISAAANGGADSIGDNNDLMPRYPANYNLNNIISVAATNSNDEIAPFSNFGPSSVHVAAPGVFILSTSPFSLNPSGYTSLTGTSMSVAHVSGLAGLLTSFYPDFTFSQIRGMVLRYVDVLMSLQGLVITNGRINAEKALSSLQAPSDLTAALQDSNALISSQAVNGINISWRDNATGEDGYAVDRKTEGDPYVRIATIAADSREYSDNTVFDGNRYMFRVKTFSLLPNPPDAQNIIAESSAVETSVTVPLNPPTGLLATPVSDTQINLAWIDNSFAEESYNVERAGPEGVFQEIATTGIDSTTFSDAGLAQETQYQYRVRAFNAQTGHSMYSNEAAAITLSSPERTDSGSGGGGGCSVSRDRNMKNAPFGLVSISVFLLITISALRRRP